MKLRRIALNLALVAGTILLMLAVGEVALRLLTPPLRGEDTLRSFTQFDATLGWRGAPGAQGTYSTRHFTIQVRQDESGFRAPPARDMAPSPPAEGAGRPRPQRVVVVGDSYGWGFGVEADEMFSARLAALRPDLQVINMAVCGYGPDQELLLLRQEGFPRRPDVVLVQLALLNDLFTILQPRAYRLPKPYFAVADGELRLLGVPVPRLENWSRISTSVAVREWLTENLRVFGWSRVRWRLLRARMQGADQARAAEMSRLRLLAREPDDAVQAGWSLAEALLARMQAEAAAAGADLVILAVADPLQVDDGLWQRGVAQAGLPETAYDRDLPGARLARVGARLGIPVIDPTLSFRQAAGAGETLYVADEDPHWNAAGHRLAAAALASQLAGGDAGQADP